MRRLVEAPLKDFSKDLDNGAKFLMKSLITATEEQEQAGIMVSVFHFKSMGSKSWETFAIKPVLPI